MIELFLLAGALPQSPLDQARLHPPDVGLYMEAPDVARMIGAYDTAPLVQLIGDQEVRETVSDLFGSMEFDVLGMVTRAATDAGVPAPIAAAPLQTLVGSLETVRGVSLSVYVEDSGFDAAARNWLECERELQELYDVLFLYATENDESFPESLAAMGVSESMSKDPWGYDYRYTVEPDLSSFEVYSTGADGQPGGDGFASDLDPGDGNAGQVILEELLAGLRVQIAMELASFEVRSQATDMLTMLLERAGLELLEHEETDVGIEPADHWKYRFDWLFPIDLEILATDRLVLIKTGAIDPELVGDRLVGRAPSLKESDGYAALAHRLGPDKGAVVMQGFSDTRDTMGILLESGALHPEEADVPVFLTAGYDNFWRMQLAGDRFVTESFSATANIDDPLVKAFAADPIPASVWRFVPPDAIGAFVSSFDAGGLYDGLMAGFGASNLESGASFLSSVEERHGFDLERDIFSSFGGGMAGYLLPISGLVSIPGLVLVVDLDDEEAFKRGLDGALSLLEEEADGEFKVKYKPYRDTPLWTFYFEGAGGPPISPSLTIIDGHLLFTLTATRAKREIKRMMALEDGDVGTHPLQDGDRIPVDATFAGYMDWAEFVGGLYTSGKAMAGLLAGSGDIPFDPNDLPEADTFTHFFEPTILWSRPVEDGFYTRWDSSFGPETWLGLAGVGAGAFFTVTAGEKIREEENELAVVGGIDHEQAERETVDTLDYLVRKLAVYKIERSRYPATLEDLLRPTSKYPNGFLADGEIPNDGWGRAMVYRPVKSGADFELWSVGPDGIDQGGSGDDLRGD